MSFGTIIKDYDLGRWGKIQYAQWLHSPECEQHFSEADIDRISKRIKPGDIILDIGAHAGDTAIPLAVAAGPNGCVIAFEPNKYVFKVLKQNAYLNPDPRIIPVMAAIMPKAGKYVFNYSDPGFCNGGWAGANEKGMPSHDHPLEVNAVRLSDYMRTHPWGRVNHVKIDVEGSELAILESEQEFFNEHKPWLDLEIYQYLTAAERERFYAFLSTRYQLLVKGSDIEMTMADFTRPGLSREVVCIPL